MIHCYFADAFGKFVGRLARYGDDFHAEAEGQACHALSYMSQADDTHRLARQFTQWFVPIAEVGACAPATVSVLAGELIDVVGHVEQQGDHMLCHAHGAIGWNVGHNHAPLACGHEVDVVVAGGQLADVLQLRELHDELAGETYFVHKHGFSLQRTLHDQFLRCTVIDGKVSQLLQLLP